MKNLNVTFLEEYKGVDKFIRDSYGCSEGVSEYIRQMEDKQARGVEYVPSWTSDYKTLKHMRWVRNQLAHEVSMDSDICDQSDIDWVREFRKMLENCSDPLSVVLTQEAEAARRRSAARQAVDAQKRWLKQTEVQISRGRSDAQSWQTSHSGRSGQTKSPMVRVPAEPANNTGKRSGKKRSNSKAVIPTVILALIIIALLAVAIYLLK